MISMKYELTNENKNDVSLFSEFSVRFGGYRLPLYQCANKVTIGDLSAIIAEKLMKGVDIKS